MVHKRKLVRLREYDYSENGYYFVTICTKNRIPQFGQISNGKMILNQYGEITLKCWQEIPKHFENVYLDEYVTMPNHIHGIIILMDDNYTVDVGKRHAFSLSERQHQKLPVIIGSYKSAVTKKNRCLNGHQPFKWQTSYYDHIIRSDESLYRIQQYIRRNPQGWDFDRENLNEIPKEEKQRYWTRLLKTGNPQGKGMPFPYKKICHRNVK